MRVTLPRMVTTATVAVFIAGRWVTGETSYLKCGQNSNAVWVDVSGARLQVPVDKLVPISGVTSCQ